ATAPIDLAVFPDSVRGKTFVWDAIAGGYAASTAAGAPANGVRFVQYVTRPPETGPSSPMTVIGYVDLTDLTTSSAAVLGLAIVGTTGSSPLTYASYTI